MPAADRIRGYRLPEWLSPLVALTRPIAVTMVIAIPAVGSASVGIASIWNIRVAEAMARNSSLFLSGIPEACWWVIGSVALGYFTSKSAEVIGAPAPPRGRNNPESAGAAATAPSPGPAAAEILPDPIPAGDAGATPELRL